MDDTKEMMTTEPSEHHVAASNDDDVTTKEIDHGEGEPTTITKLSTAEENADNKQHIPTKNLRQKEFASQVKAHLHHHTHDGKHDKRLKPGHGTAREMLEVTYPSPMIPTKAHTHAGGKSLKIGPGKKPIGAPTSSFSNHENNDKRPSAYIDKSPHITLGKEEKEEAMLKVVDKLQTLSDDKLAAEMKGPILALAKQKIIEDLMSFKSSPKKNAPEDGDSDKALCTRDGHCFGEGEDRAIKPVVADTNTQMVNEFVKKLQETSNNKIPKQQQPSQGPSVSAPKPIVSNNNNNNILDTAISTLTSGQQQQQKNPITTFLQQPQQQPQQYFQKIPAQLPASQQPQQQQQQQLDFRLPNFNAQVILDRYPELRNSGLTTDSLTRLALRVPHLEERIQKHFSNKRHQQEVLERNKQISDKNTKLYSSQNFMKQFKEYLDGPTKTELETSKPLQFITSSFDKPLGIDSRPCRRDGSCSFPEPLYHKPPHSMSPKPDVWIKDAFLVPTGFKDDTRLTPDHLMPIGPDPRIQDYYTSYMQGHPGTYQQPLPQQIQPPPPSPPPPPPMHMIDMQTVIEHGSSPSFYPPPAPPPPPPPSQLPPSINEHPVIDMQTTVENLPSGATIESTTTLEPPYPHGGIYQWTPFSVCSVTCGQGEKKRFRRCVQQDCPTGGVEIETATCIEPPCPGKTHNLFVNLEIFILASLLLLCFSCLFTQTIELDYRGII